MVESTVVDFSKLLTREKNNAQEKQKKRIQERKHLEVEKHRIQLIAEADKLDVDERTKLKLKTFTERDLHTSNSTAESDLETGGSPERPTTPGSPNGGSILEETNAGKKNIRVTSATHRKSDTITSEPSIQIILPESTQLKTALNPFVAPQVKARPKSAPPRQASNTIVLPESTPKIPSTKSSLKKSRKQAPKPPPPDTVVMYIPPRKIRKDPVERMNAFKPSSDEQVLEAFTSEPSLQAAAFLFDRIGASPNVQNQLGTRPIHNAVKIGLISAVKMLLKQRNIDINVKEDGTLGGYTPLHYAVKSNNIEVTEMLLQNGANPNIQDSIGFTSLHHAAKEGFADMVKLLLSNGADGTILDSSGRPPIYWSQLFSHSYTSSLLPNIKYDWYTQMILQPKLHPIPIRVPREPPPKKDKKKR